MKCHELHRGGSEKDLKWTSSSVGFIITFLALPARHIKGKIPPDPPCWNSPTSEV